MATQRPATERLSIRLSKVQMDKLKAHALEKDMSLTQAIEEFIRKL